MPVINKIIQQLTDAGLKNRIQQHEMIDAVYQQIKKQAILCIEAPTGTGKTLAYCLGALSARKDQQTIVISTATTALQEQFFQKDLPLLETILKQKLSVTLAKGRRRYVCHARLYKPEQFSDINEHTFQIEQLQHLLNTNKWNGEADKLSLKVDEACWQKVSTDASGCAGGRCEYFNECVFFQNRRKMHQADIVVVNHNLLLSDLELGGGVILPEMKNSIYILDECHHLPEKALSHFAKQAAVLRSFDWINLVSKALNKAALQIKLPQSTVEKLNQHVKTVVEVLWEAKEYLDERKINFIENQWRVKKADELIIEIAKKIIPNAEKTASLLYSVLSTLDTAYEKLINTDKAQAEVINHLQSSLNFIAERAENLAKTWQDLVMSQAVDAQPPIACWFEKIDTRDGIDYTLHTSPINVSKAMQELFWDKIEQGAVLCSGTIRAMGKFNDFLRKIGLKDNEKLQTKALVSPFEYQQSVLFIPQMNTEPSLYQQDKHLQEIQTLLPQLILPSYGTLILFTSRKAMEITYQAMPSQLKQEILLQDDYGKMEIIKLHKEKIDQAQRSIIFGLASLAEGIDLPGKYCQHVIIQKIPFSVPSDPISQTRSEWLQKHDADPFHLITLPETSIKLTQYIGRLLRHEDDRGIVTILDKRLFSKNYGAALLENLPPFTRLVNQSLEVFKQHDFVATHFNPS